MLSARDGQVAIDLLALSSTPKPGLILLDFMMPVMNGATFLSNLQQKLPDIFTSTPIFFMTARTDTPQLAIKTTGVLMKPMDLDELAKVATRYCTPDA